MQSRCERYSMKPTKTAIVVSAFCALIAGCGRRDRLRCHRAPVTAPSHIQRRRRHPRNRESKARRRAATSTNRNESCAPAQRWVQLPPRTPAGELYCEDVALDALAERYGTPLTCIRAARSKQAYRAYAAALDGRNALVCYASRPTRISRCSTCWLARGAGFDIVSGGELARVLAAGGDPRRRSCFPASARATPKSRLR